MRSRRKWYAVLSVGLAALGISLLLTHLDARGALTSPQGLGNPWPLTGDGRSRFAAWSPDGHTVLVNRLGAVVGDGATRQALSELWALDVGGEKAALLSKDGIRPAYAADGQRLAYLAFAGGGRWQVRVLDLASGRVGTRTAADWRMPPAWIGQDLAFARSGQVWLGDEAIKVVPAGALVRVSAAQGRIADTSPRDAHIAWSDGAHLWAQPRAGEDPRLLAAGAPVVDLAWSPDGRWLAYVTVDEDLAPALWAADVIGEEPPRLLVQGQGEVFSAPSWSPDGRTLAFSRAPLGAATAAASDVWLVEATGENLRLLLRTGLEESDPVWSPDGRYLAFNRAGDVWVLDVTRPLEAVAAPSLPETDGALVPAAQQTPPATIRVIHRESNYYRSDVPPGQIDVIPFETYVKRATPVEMPASWALEALKTQAVAARTYAWYYTIVHAGWDWDVSDWTDYQVMGRDDQRHWRSDLATDDTQGQYVAYQGDVIKAYYSAENGCPTRGIEGVGYIEPVDDPVSFGQERWGHGWGMSQWGARRWAEWHGWGYQQILTHYYSGVTVELPSSGGPLPLGGVTLPWADFFVTGNRVYVTANASDEASTLASALGTVGFYAVTDAVTATALFTDTVGSDGWSTVWDVTALSDTASTQITLALRIVDGQGHVQSQGEVARIGLDRRPPTDTTAVIDAVYSDTLTITIASLSATDPSPGSGAQAMAFSNAGWAWEGEGLYHEAGTGEQVDDADALNGKAWRGLAGVHISGAWYGPYTTVLQPGRAYRAYFRLKTGDATTTAEVATLDVVDDAGVRLLGLRRLRGTDFRAAGVYQEFPVDLIYDEAGTAGLEFRTAFRSTADLYLDRVLIVSYPVPLADSTQWRLPPGGGLKTVTVKFIDGAGNVSADLTRTVFISDTRPPTGWQGFVVEWGEGWEAFTSTVGVFDEFSGLNVDSARYRLSVDGGLSWGDWTPAACTGLSATVDVQTVTASAVPLSQSQEISGYIQFQIADMHGNIGATTYRVHRWTVYLPLVTRD